MNVLVTGGAGYIGSHACVALLEAGYSVTVIDNLCNSSETSLARVEAITGRKLSFFQIDLLNKEALTALFKTRSFDAVVHFAGLKSISESITEPDRYYRCNIDGTKNLIEVMRFFNVDTLVFSSSASVYGIPDSLPILESSPKAPTNPYGESKLRIENLLEDLVSYDEFPWKITCLRYFNPIGAHSSGLLGENPAGIPCNLMPLIIRAASNQTSELLIYGDDYDTEDGTGVRDYIHVMDLVDGHLAALAYLKQRNQARFVVANLGTGNGISVLSLVQSYEKASGQTIPYRVVERRPGDVAVSFADVTIAETTLNWRAKRTLEDMCKDTVVWHRKNPFGYED